MKAKLFFSLLLLLFIIPAHSAPQRKKTSRPRISHLRIDKRASTRTPLEDFEIAVNVTDNALQIIFLSHLSDSQITVMDKGGNIVANEHQTFIYEGKTLHIYTPNAYPYKVEITSPSMDVTGEIIQEEF
nr:DUF3244 domain-containing protein [uncultured Bacteroides sp.]